MRGPLQWRAERARVPKTDTSRTTRGGPRLPALMCRATTLPQPIRWRRAMMEAAGKVHRDAANRRSDQTRPGPSLPAAAPRGRHRRQRGGSVRPSRRPRENDVRNWPGRGGRAPPAEFPRSSLALRGSLPVTTERFHVLLNPLFRVLCNFPSRYLFAIGLVELFSLGWSLPPA